MASKRGAHRLTSRQWIKTGSLVISLLITTIVAAAPTDLTPTDIDGPKFDPRAEEAGAFSVNDRTGTVGYNYKFKLPPGRGVAPELMLTYSSAGAVRGGVAQGWDLAPLPAIKRDVVRENGTQKEFTATFGGSIAELVPAFGVDVTAHGGSAFRAKIDTTFTRFEQWNCGGSFSGTCWTAFTMDGRVHEFTEFLPGDWKLVTVTDVWGNHSRYFYDPVSWAGATVDYILREIRYTYGVGGDTTAGIQPHARVLVDYDPLDTTSACAGTGEFTYGLRLPAGAAVNYRTGAREITGLRRLTVVHAQVRDVALDTSWRDVHLWTLRYRAQAEACALASPRRQIDHIEEVGIIPGQTLPTPGPTVTFYYGREAKSTPTIPTDITLPATPPPIGTTQTPLGLSDTSCPQATTEQRVTYSMMADVDGDGLPDLLRTDGVIRAEAGGGYCPVYWYKNLGGTFETENSRASNAHEIHLPAPAPTTSPLYSIGCGLNMAWKDRYSLGADSGFCTPCTSDSQCTGTGLCVQPTVDSDSVCLVDCSGAATCPTGTTCRIVTSVSGTSGHQCVPNNGTCPGVPSGPHCDSTSTLVGADRRIYRWVDIDGDGRVDVITEGNPASPPAEEAQLCKDPACVLDPSNASLCQPVPCAVAGATQVPELITAPTDATQYSPPECARHPAHITEPTCANGYSWNILFNRGGSFETVSRCSPVALGNGGGAVPNANPSSRCIPNNTDPPQPCTTGSDCCSYFCRVINGTGTCMNPTETLPAGHLADLIDVNGDRIPDIVSASYSRVAVYQIPNGPPTICLYEPIPGNMDCGFCRDYLQDPTASCEGPNSDKEYCCLTNNVTWSEVPGTWCPYSLQHRDPTPDRMVYNVFFGRGDGTFGAPQLWSWPEAWRPRCDDHLPGRNPLLDLNGDGIPDLLHQKTVELTPGGNTYSVEVAFGNGNGFDSTYQGDPSTLQSDPSSVVLNPGIQLFRSVNTTDCTKQYPSFLKDLDGDGLVDFACMQSDSASPCAARSQGGPSQGVAFGNGGGFTIFSGTFDTAPVNVAGTQYNLGGTSQIQVLTGGTRVAQDYLDLNGDGIPERYYLNTPLDPQLHVDLWTPDNDANGPPGLLYKVENGIGATTKFHYTRSIDQSVVKLTSKQPGEYSANWDDWIAPAMPFPTWVVSRVEVDSGSDHRETSYLYYDPVFVPDDPLASVGGHVVPCTGDITCIGGGITIGSPQTTSTAAPGRRFRGFQAVLTTLPANPGETAPLAFERFTYRHDPDGLLDFKELNAWDQSLLGYTQMTVDQTTYASEALVGGVARFPHAVASVHFECSRSTERDCVNTGRATQTSYHYSPNNVDGSNPQFVLFWTLTAKTETTTTFDGAPLERDHWFTHRILDSGTPPYYLDLQTTTRDLVPASGGPITMHVEEYFYDNSNDVSTCGTLFGSCRGALTKKRVYRDPSAAPISTPACSQVSATGEPLCVDYGFGYDSVTGNKTLEVRPAAMIAAGGNPTAAQATQYSYDTTYSLFPIEVRNELNQRITRTFDLGTGLKTQESGPNDKLAQTCQPRQNPKGGGFGFICHATRVYEERDWSYDGLGRMLSESMPHDDPNLGYVPTVVRRLRYAPFPANQVTEYHALEWGACDCGSDNGCSSPCPGLASQTIRDYDGLDRLTESQVKVTDGAYEDHRYAYDARGMISSASDPNPALESGGATFVSPTVTHVFEHDARGRVTKVTAPDRATVLISYAPWQKTATDADGIVNAQTFDGFGQLREVRESGQTAAEDNWAPAASELATTVYSYDGIGRLSRILDADCIAGLPSCADTSFTHDGENHRTLIQRGPKRPWTYAYDANGGLASKRDPDGRVTTYSHDVLERVQCETVTADPLMDSATQTSVGVGQLYYIYDNGRVAEDINGFAYRNRVGRLAAVEMRTGIATCPPPSGQAPYAAVDYAYDGSGDTTVEQWTLNLPETGTQHFNLVRDFGPNSTLQATTYPNGQVALWDYDQRGKVSQVEAAGASVARFTYGLAGLQLSRQALGATSNQPLQRFDRTYDLRGRIHTESLTAPGGAIAATEYTYSPDGDLQSFGITNSLSASPDTWQIGLTFRYDGLHRLRAATWEPNLRTAPGYFGRFLYSPAGNVSAAEVFVTSNAVPNRSVTYAYGPIQSDGTDADPQAVQQLNDSISGAQWSFRYDRAGNLLQRGVAGHQAQYRPDANDQIRQVTTSDGVERYFYDHGRHRFLAIDTNGSSTTWRFYLGDEFEADGQTSSTPPPMREEINLAASGEAIARLTNNCSSAVPPSCDAPALSIQHHDGRGDLLAAISASGIAQAHFTYGAYGELLESYDPTNDWRRRFNGKEQDQIDGLSYYGYRYFDPLTLQWTSSDPANRFLPDVNVAMPQRLNLYAFELNNPLRNVDPDGKEPPVTDTQIRAGEYAGTAMYHLGRGYGYGMGTIVTSVGIGGPLPEPSDANNGWFIAGSWLAFASPLFRGGAPEPAAIPEAIPEPAPLPELPAGAPELAPGQGVLLPEPAGGGVAEPAPSGSTGAPKPTEPYNRLGHYGRTPTAADRNAVGGESVDHVPPLVKRYYEGDPAKGEKPGYQQTSEQRRASASDRTRMRPSTKKEQNKQGGEMSNYSKKKKKEHGL